MKLENMKAMLAKKLGKELGGFIYDCMTNRFESKTYPGVYRGLWEESRTYHDFLRNVEADDRLKYVSQAYGELCKIYNFGAPVRIDGQHRRSVECDAGGVQIGDLAGTVVMRIPNCAGDGSTQVCIIEKGTDGRFNRNAFRFSAVIEGRFQIYGSDCEEPTPSDHADLDGRYAAYAYSGTVVFEQWD